MVLRSLTWGGAHCNLRALNSWDCPATSSQKWISGFDRTSSCFDSVLKDLRKRFPCEWTLREVIEGYQLGFRSRGTQIYHMHDEGLRSKESELSWTFCFHTKRWEEQPLMPEILSGKQWEESHMDLFISIRCALLTFLCAWDVLRNPNVSSHQWLVDLEEQRFEAIIRISISWA